MKTTCSKLNGLIALSLTVKEGIFYKFMTKGLYHPRMLMVLNSHTSSMTDTFTFVQRLKDSYLVQKYLDKIPYLPLNLKSIVSKKERKEFHYGSIYVDENCLCVVDHFNLYMFNIKCIENITYCGSIYHKWYRYFSDKYFCPPHEYIIGYEDEGRDRQIVLLDCETYERVEVTVQHGVRFMSYAGERVAVANTNNTVTIRDLNLTVVHTLQIPDVEIVCYSPNGKNLCIVDKDKVSIWDTETWLVKKTIESDDTQCVCYSPDSRYLAIGYTNTIAIWDTNTYTQLYTFPVCAIPIQMCFTIDAKYMFIAASTNRRLDKVYMHKVRI